jgi:hypothetical protein
MNAIIRPTDFNRNTADPHRNTWTPGQMRHVMRAIDATPHARTMIETVTGLLQELQIVGVTESSAGRYARVTLRHTWTKDGVEKHQDTRHLLFEIGAVIVTNLTIVDSTRFNAVESYRNEAGALIRQAQAEHGETEGRAYGKWDAEPGAYDNMGWVTYEPYTGSNPNAAKAGTRWYGRVTVTHVKA